MEQTVSGSFALNIIVMTIFGFYPSNKHKRAYKIYAYTVYILGMVPQIILGVLYFALVEDFTNLNYSSENTDFVTFAIVFYSFKILPVVLRGEKIKNCVKYFDQITYSIIDEEQIKIVKACGQICERNSRIYFGGSVVGWIHIIVQAAFVKHELPYSLYLPDVVKNNPVLYFVSYVVIVMGSTYAIVACSVIDPLIGGLLHHAAAQLQVLEKQLEQIGTYINKPKTLNTTEVYQEVRRWIQRYQVIAGFVEQFQECFSSIVFIQFMGSSVVIAFCCFAISRTSGIDLNSLLLISYLGMLFFQLFFYCYFGTMLITKNETFSSALYMTQWYKFDIQAQKSLMILMERCKKPMEVKAGNILDLSLETFTMILKKAYSVLAVLNNY